MKSSPLVIVALVFAVCAVETMMAMKEPPSSNAVFEWGSAKRSHEFDWGSDTKRRFNWGNAKRRFNWGNSKRRFNWGNAKRRYNWGAAKRRFGWA